MRSALLFIFFIKTAFAPVFATAPNYGNIMEFECEKPRRDCAIWISYNIAYQYEGDNNPKLLEDKIYNLKLKEKKAAITAGFYVKNGLVYDFRRSDGVAFKGPRVFEDIYLEIAKKWRPDSESGDVADSMGELSSGISVNKIKVAPVLIFAIPGRAPLNEVFMVSSMLAYTLSFEGRERRLGLVPDGRYTAELLYPGVQYEHSFYARSGRFANFDVKNGRVTRFFSNDGIGFFEAPDDELVLLMNNSLQDLENGADVRF